MSGLTGFVLDEAALKRIALERNVSALTSYSQLTEQMKDLLLADILYTVYLTPYNIPSFQHQHGQFSTSTGQQVIKDKDSIYSTMIALYRKWGDKKLELIPNSSLQWTE